MRDYVTSPSLVCPTFFQAFVAFELFSRGYSSHLCCFGNYFLIKFKICMLKKPRLGGDFSNSDVITPKGHYPPSSDEGKKISIY